jgi:hypothetical protein
VLAKVLAEPEVSLQGWADQITEASGEAVEKTLVIGRLFLAAKKALRHGEWQRLFKGHARAVAHPVRFTVTVALMYMAVAEDPRLSNRNLGSYFPPSLSALYQLKFIPDPMFSGFIAAGLITPNLTKAQAMALRDMILPYRMRLQKFPKQVINRLRSYAAIINSLENDQARLFRYTTMVNEELSAPLQVGEDGRIQSGVVWIPPFTQPLPIKARPIKVKHRCECGHEHEDQRTRSRTGKTLPDPSGRKESLPRNSAFPFQYNTRCH